MRVVFLLFSILIASSVQADPPRVAADVAPVHGLVGRVMAGVGAPDLVIAPGADPHGYAMRPSEARSLSRADIVFWVGPALTPWLQDPLETLAPQALHVTLQDVPGLTLLEYRAGARFEAHDHGHDHGHDRSHDHAKEEDDGHGSHADHDAAAVKPHQIDGHIWLDPENALLWLDEIAAVLAQHDAENAPRYRSNAAEAKAEIENLADEIAAMVEPLRDRPFIVFHDGYHYFEARFDIEAAGSVTVGDGGTASAARLAKVREVVNESGAVCALAEPRASPGLIDAVSEGNSLRVAVLDPMGVDLPPGPGFYPALLRQIAERLTTCLQAP